jgi:hypothetical protein
MESEIGYRIAGLGMLACLLGSLLWPWVTKKPDRPYQISQAAGCALAASVLFGVYNLVMPKKYNIRVDLLFLVPALLVVWAQCLVLTLVNSQSRTGGTPND